MAINSILLVYSLYIENGNFVEFWKLKEHESRTQGAPDPLTLAPAPAPALAPALALALALALAVALALALSTWSSTSP